MVLAKRVEVLQQVFALAQTICKLTASACARV